MKTALGLAALGPSLHSDHCPAQASSVGCHDVPTSLFAQKSFSASFLTKSCPGTQPTLGPGGPSGCWESTLTSMLACPPAPNRTGLTQAPDLGHKSTLEVTPHCKFPGAVASQGTADSSPLGIQGQVLQTNAGTSGDVHLGSVAGALMESRAVASLAWAHMQSLPQPFMRACTL